MSDSQPAGSYYRQWQTLNDWLVQHRLIWQPAPFTEPRPAWVQVFPGLGRMAEELTDAQCDELEHRPALLAEKAARYLPGLARYRQRVTVPDLSPGPEVVEAATLPEVRATDMPGRKRMQAGHFTAALTPLRQPVIDWCSGKGHLSRTLAGQTGQGVQGYEWNPELVAAGNRLAARFGEAVYLQCQNVMDDKLPLPMDAHGVALHACGDLHRQLLKLGAATGVSRLSFSPCCYHKSAEHQYRLLSAQTETYGNRLTPERSDLRLAVRETVTARSGVRAQTKILEQWRLGFDGLQRALRGRDNYLPVPSCSPRLVRQGFPAFCRWAAEQKRLSLPEHTDFGRWLAHGALRQAQVRRFELVRHLFRRPLELWLVLDYAIFLEEQGYEVRVGRFCPRSLTPRNLLLDAVKK